jgi:tetratricopeptide (TPR) repeat protein
MRSSFNRTGLLALAVLLFWGPAGAEDNARAINRLLIQAGNAEQKNDYDGAIAAYSQIIKIKPDDEAILVDRGSSYNDKKDYARVIADFTDALKRKPNDAMAHNNRGVAYLGLSDEAHALADFDAAVRLNPDYLEALGNRAMAYDAMHDFTRAIADYGAILKAQPQNADALNARCWDRAFANRELDAALADCDAALALLRNKNALAAVRDSRGFVWFRKGDMVKAIADYDAALALAPKMAETLYKRGLARNRKGEKGKADIAAALKLDPHAGDDMAEIGLKP